MQRYTDVPSYDQMKDLFNRCDNNYWKRIAQGLYYTGARAGELIQIKPDDIKVSKDNPTFLEIRIHTEKNPHAPIRFVPVDTVLEPDALQVFSTEHNNTTFPPHNPNILSNSFLRVMRKRFNEYWGVAPHYFRHCRLTHMVTKFDFNDQELVKYAGWCDSKPAKWYMSLKVSDLIKKMGSGGFS